MTGYIAGVILVVLAFGVWIFRRRSYGIRANSISGNVQIGDNSGTVNQTFSAPAGLAPGDRAPPDRIAWAIGIVGVFVALAQFAHDIFFGK